MRYLLAVAAFAAATVLPFGAAQERRAWATVKGRIVFPDGKDIPARAVIEVTQDRKHCLGNGPLLDDSLLVHAKNRGVRNVVVWLRPNATDTKAAFDASEIHPDDAKRKPATVVIDQPRCQYVPRVVAARVGDTVEVRNASPVAHNAFFDGPDQFGESLPPKDGTSRFTLLPSARNGPIQYKCSIHPWMMGYVRAFDHPYYAVTDETGAFTIPNAPVGKYRLVVWHEKVGFLGGAPGRFGTPVEIKGGGTELPAMPFAELAK